MADSLDVFRYMSYLRLRWRVIAASCAIAVTLAAVVSLLLPRRYTATARIVIEPPAGTDPRGAIAVSPIYLESLKTYEQFASSDSLFRKASEKFALRSSEGGPAIETLKKRVLRVGLLRNTRILEIACTLNNPPKSQQLAQFIAESTVDLNRSVLNTDNQHLVQGLQQQAATARARVEELDGAWSHLLVNEPVQDLQAEMETASEARYNLQQQISSVELELADAAEREKQAAPQEREQIHREQANSRARLDQEKQQLQALDKQTAEREKTLSARMADRDKLDAERKVAQAALASAETRLREGSAEAGYRGERLAIIDPGVIPERPSSPNVPLNLAAAFLLGLLLPVVYLAVEMNYQEQRAASRRGVLEAMAKEGR